MISPSDILFADNIGELGAKALEENRLMNDRLNDTARTCGDMTIAGTVIRIDLYHVRRFEAGSGADWHRHPFTELTWIEGGPIQYEYSGSKTTLHDGEYFIMPAFAPHRWHVPASITVLHGFMLTIMPVSDREHSLVPIIASSAASMGYRIRNDRHTSDTLLRAEQEAMRSDALGIEAASGYMRAALAGLLRRIMAEAPPQDQSAGYTDETTPPAALERAIAFITTNMSNPIDVSTVARHARISPRQLDRLFHASFDMPTGEFLLHTRLERARHLLSDSDLSIKQIARTCGFSDPNYFSRIFRKRHKRSPREYRAGERP